MWKFLEDLQQGVTQDLITRFSGAIPKISIALILLLIGIYLARTVKKVFERLLAAMGVDRAASQINDIDVVQQTGMTIKVSSTIASMLYYVLLLIFVILSTDILGVKAITDMVRDVVNYLPSLFSSLILLLLGIFVADMARQIVSTTLQSLGFAAYRIVSSAVFYFLLVSMVISALSQAKIDTNFLSNNLTILIGSIAFAFAIGYGIASRDMVSNYLAGFYNRNKVRVGDDVRIIGVRGKVVMIDATSIVLQTPERAILVPLSKLTTEKVEIFYPDAQQDNLLDSPATEA
ncbi:MAG TPA: mechanosensitive ion channel [Saprospiraceae bacterium]|nr:mechanosensitive ion channel [Saprospiraceae bacterium]HND88242.1 mechanosensitive ion channel [Saprospiraceae bacterium]HNG89268.1 mechanosensitive ion channel [Saprospiraceae bacterium]